MNEYDDNVQIDLDALIEDATLLLRDANRWRKLEMLMSNMIDHEPKWWVYPSSFDDYFESIEEMREAIDEIDPIAPYIKDNV